MPPGQDWEMDERAERAKPCSEPDQDARRRRRLLQHGACAESQLVRASATVTAVAACS